MNMKHIRLLLPVFLWMTLPLFSQTHVVIDLKDPQFAVGVYSNRSLSVQAIGFPLGVGNSVLLGAAINTTTDSSGSVTLSNLQVAAYDVTVKAPPLAQKFTFGVTATNLGTIYAGANLIVSTNMAYPSGGYSWSIAASDARYAAIGAGGTGQTEWPYTAITNAPWFTNGGTLAATGLGLTVADPDTVVLGITNTDTSYPRWWWTPNELFAYDTESTVSVQLSGVGDLYLSGDLCADRVFGDGSGLTNINSTATNLASGLSATNLSLYSPTFVGGISVSNVFTNVFNVRDFGAVGDGAADDTAAIQATIDAATNAIVFWPAGTYKVAKTLTENPGGYAEWKHALTLWSDRVYRGEGRQNTKIIADFSRGEDMPVMLMPPGQSGNITVQDLTVDGNLQAISIGGEDEGINLKAGTNVVFRSLCLTNCGQDGLDLDVSRNALVDDCWFMNNNGNGIHASGSGNWYFRVANSLFVSNGWTRVLLVGSTNGVDNEIGEQSGGLDMSSVVSGSVVNTDFRHNVRDVILGIGSSDLVVSACKFVSYQQLPTTNIYVRSCRRATVTGCTLFNSANGGIGVSIVSGSTNINVANCSIWQGNQGLAVHIVSSGSIQLQNNNLYGNYAVYVASILAGHPWLIDHNILASSVGGSALRLMTSTSGENGVISFNHFMEGKLYGGGPSDLTVTGNRFSGGPTDNIQQASGSRWRILDNYVLNTIRLSGDYNVLRGNRATTLNLDYSGSKNNHLVGNTIGSFTYNGMTAADQRWGLVSDVGRVVQTTNTYVNLGDPTNAFPNIYSTNHHYWNGTAWSLSDGNAATATNWLGSNAMQAQIDLSVTNTQSSVSFGSISLSTTHQETTWTLDDETGDTTMEVGAPDTNIVFTSEGTIKANFSGDGSGLTNLAATAISGVLTQGHSAEVTLSNALTVVGTNYVTKLRVGGAADTTDAINVTGTIKSSSAFIGGAGNFSSYAAIGPTVVRGPSTGKISLRDINETGFSCLTLGPTEATWPSLYPSTNGGINLSLNGSLTASNGVVSGTNSVQLTDATGIVQLGALPTGSATNLSTMAPDFNKSYSTITTNDAFTFLDPLNVSDTLVQTAVIWVTNSTATVKTVTAPANVHTQGTWNVTNSTIFTFWHYAGIITNAIAFPLW